MILLEARSLAPAANTIRRGTIRCLCGVSVAGEPHRYKTVVKKAHCDVYGHVNNASYLTLFEEARWDLITANGYGIDKIQSTNLGPVVLEAHVKWLKELREGQEIEIETELLEYPSKVGTLKQSMTAVDGDSAASTASFVFGLFDLERR